jgi:hypothetical protein
MCQDPGLLLCQGQLKDCSGKGDCFKGRCYCHVGWGGPDCSVPICEKLCKDVRLCFYMTVSLTLLHSKEVVEAKEEIRLVSHGGLL